MTTTDPTQAPCEIGNVEFASGITGDDKLLQKSIPHIVFAGRSNAGKSSVINTVAGSEVARVSQKPGKTQQINLYQVGEGDAFLVDLPGYGYAKISAKEAEKIRKQMIWYLARSDAPIALLVLVIDIRRGLQEIDHELLDIADSEVLPTVILANKIDKCNQSELIKKQRQLQSQVEDRAGVRPDMLQFSARTGKGKKALCELITSVYAN